MELNEYINSVRDFLLKNKKPSYTTTNKTEVRVRCPYCGDSKKDPSSAHLYIAMKPPFKFHCFKCESSGVLSQSTLRDFGIYDSELSVNIIESKKLIKDKSNTKVKIDKNKLNFNIPESQNSINAVEYFNNRFGTNFTNEELCKKFKAITNASDFFNLNRLYYNRAQQSFNMDNAIGFSSSDGSHIVFRDITGCQQTRYFNLLLDNMSDTASKIYNISSPINIMSEKITLIITEGIFDIIGVYNAFHHNYPEESTIYTAACGKGYASVISNYIRKGFLDMDIIIYSDADVEPRFFENLKKSSPFIRNQNITIYYNTVGKDFGVSKDKISLKKIII